LLSPSFRVGGLHIALENTETETLQVLFGNGDGTFHSGITLALPGDILALGDLNGDGKADLIAQGLQILLGNGDGTFTMKPLLATAGRRAAILGDLNGDGIPDIVVAAAGTHRSDAMLPDIVSIVMGNGDGTFAIAPTYALPQFPVSVVAADLNNDGKADVVAAFLAQRSGETGFATLLNLGTNFATPVVTSVIPALFPLSLVAADFNGDGRIDLGFTNVAVGIFLGNGDGTVQPGVFYDQGTQAPTAVGDFNGDGVPDIVGFDEASFSVNALLGNGDGTFGFALTSPAGGFVAALAVGDFNGDGKLDVATIVSLHNGTSNGPFVASLLLGEGNGTFALQPTTYNVGPSASTIAVGDLNGDGIPDLVIGNGDGFDGPSTVAVLLGLGGGAFAAPITTMVGNGISSIVTGDFNLDGKTDVAVSNTLWNDVSVLLGNGDGTFQPAVNFAMAGGGALTAADFNGDGSLDLAAVSAGPAALSVLYSGVSGAAAVTSPSSLIFGNQGVGHASPTQNVTLTNSGSAPLRISAIAISGADRGDYQQSDSCGATLAAAAHCTINVTFTPSAAGRRTAAIQITDNAFNSPQSVSLDGTAGTPSAMASVAPASLSFGNQFVGSSSAAQAITISSTGNIPLTIGSVSLSGAQVSDFSQTSSTCSSTLPNGSSCTVSINFTPAALGGGSASLTVTDNAGDSPQVTSLSGTGVAQTIGLGIASGGSNSATVTAGQTATDTLSIGGAGITGTASLTCTGAPAGAVCTIPASENFSGSAATTFTVEVSTTSRMAETRPGPSSTHLPWATLIMGWLVVSCGRVRTSAKKQSIRRLPLLLLFVLFLISCGGSGSGGSSPGGTAPATYDLQVTAMSGTTSQATSLSLTVR
jgi:FG-GAP-like repeat/Abnormal spindle-like microcephaly-assoc'd, ASPM-SPD-2-Hydin